MFQNVNSSQERVFQQLKWFFYQICLIKKQRFKLYILKKFNNQTFFQTKFQKPFQKNNKTISRALIKMTFQIQNTIKRNAQQIRSYVTDLYDWQQEMQLKQKAKMKILKQQRAKQQEISRQLEKQIQQEKRKKQAQEAQNKANQGQVKKDLIRDTNTIKDYYSAWDKFNIDKEIEKLEEQEKRPYKPYNPYENSQNYIRAKPKAKVNINVNSQRTAVLDPTQLKDKGNLHYKVCEYEKAINAYSQCLQKLQQISQNLPPNQVQKNNKLKCVVYSNRAMTYMKINERSKALNDCNESLRYDPLYVKSYLRRADCHKKLGNFRQSLEDFKKVKELDPQDKQVRQQIVKLEKYLEKLYKQARQSLIIKNTPSVIPDSYRIPIEQVQVFQTEQELQKNNNKQKKVNYLQQL